MGSLPGQGDRMLYVVVRDRAAMAVRGSVKFVAVTREGLKEGLIMSEFVEIPPLLLSKKGPGLVILLTTHHAWLALLTGYAKTNDQGPS